MLQKFRTIDLVWDLANKNFHQAIELSSSDEQGRRIVVQVLDNGQIVDLTGVGLNLYWETKDKHYMGLDNFTALDVRKGLFELYATTELLANVGALKGHLYLVTAEGEAITSLSLDINVNQGINTEAVESHNSFSALTDALSRVVNIETDEILRKEAESLRVQAEQAREQAEGLRESRYVEAESERDDLYQTAEQDRYNLYQSAEQERESNFEGRASQLEATYAPRLSEIEDDYVWFDKESSEGVLEDLWGGQAKISIDEIADKNSSKLLSETLDEKANKGTVEWRELNLINGWTISENQYARYYKNDFGEVFVEGYIAGGSSVDFAQMSSSYRPGRILYRVNATSSSQYILISRNGLLSYQGNIAPDYILFNFSYRAAD